MTNSHTSRRVNRREGERGFALLVIFLMAAAVSIALYVEMPRVAFESQRNREELLVQRGEQYKRGIELYYRKMKTYPQKMEDLENTNNFRFLRKRYKDPLTGKDEWRIIHMGPAGLTDSLVEKMPGLDGNKGKDGKEMAANGSSSSTSTTTDPNAPKDADDITAGSNRTERDQRALLAQRGGANGLPAQFDPNNPNAGQQGAPVDPNQAFQQEQLRKYQEQMALQQQQQGNQQGNPQNPGAPPMSQMNAGGMQAPAMPNPNGDPNANPFNNPQQQQNPQNQNQFPPVGSQNGPVRTLFQPGQMPFNPGNAMIRGAIPNPANSVANSQNSSEYQPPNPPPNPFAQPQQTTMTGGPGQQNSFNVPQAVRNQLTNPMQRPTTGQNQAFGGGGIAGIASNAGGSGIKRYGERSKYKEWEFVYDYRKPGKGAKKGVTGVGGLNTTNGQQTPNSGFGNQGGGSFGSGGNPGGSFGNSGGFGGNNNSGGFGSNPRRP